MTGASGAAAPSRAAGRPLRILTQSLSLNPLGGVELCTLQDSLALAARGHSVDLLFGADGVLRADYAAAGITLEGPVSFGFDPRRPLGDLAHFVRPARWARSRDPDLLWLSRFEHIVWGQAVARWAGCPIVCHLHHLPNYSRVRTLSRGVAQFIAVSHHMRDVWVAAGLDPADVTVIENAVPAGRYPFGGLPERAVARSALGIADTVAVVLYYGRVVAEKGVGTLLESWAALGPGTQDALLVIVGSPDPDDDPDLARLRGRLSPEAVRWCPNQEDVVPFLHAADLVVFPSWLDEAFGRVIIEGMATGRPVLASRVGAVPEILDGAMARFLVEPRSVDSLAAGIAALLDWRATEPDLGADCAAWVGARYPFDRHVSAVEGVLQRYRRRR